MEILKPPADRRALSLGHSKLLQLLIRQNYVDLVTVWDVVESVYRAGLSMNRHT